MVSYLLRYASAFAQRKKILKNCFYFELITYRSEENTQKYNINTFVLDWWNVDRAGGGAVAECEGDPFCSQYKGCLF